MHVKENMCVREYVRERQNVWVWYVRSCWLEREYV